MHAFIAAGGIPKVDEPLYQLTQGINKALLPIAGKPMIQWVLDAASSSGVIESITVIGLDQQSGLQSKLPLRFLPNQGSLVLNVRAGAKLIQEIYPDADLLMALPADVPAVTPQIVASMAQLFNQTNHDIYYSVVEKSVMEERFPGSKRTYVSLRDKALCGGDIHAVRLAAALDEKALYNDLFNARKNPLKQAALVGLDVLLLLLLKRLTLEEAAQRISQRLGIRARAVICPYAEAGMDVDKPFQHSLVEADMLSRKI